jgi:hypothetical protein
MANEPKGAAHAEPKGSKGEEPEPKPKARPIDTAGATEKLADSRAAMAKAEGQLKVTQVELSRLRLENEQLRREVKDLKRASAAVEELDPITGLPEGAGRLLESTVLICAATGARAHARRGDVLLMTDDSKRVEAAQRAIGNAARVYGVDEETAKNLDKAGWVQVSARV